MAERKAQTTNICMTCDTEVFKKCKWVHKFKPIEGWTAEKVKLKLNNFKTTTTYHVTACPNYVNQTTRIRKCAYCGNPITGNRRLYCSKECCVKASRAKQKGKNK